MKNRRRGDLRPVPIQQNRLNRIDGNAVITVQEMADQVWTEGRRQFVAPIRVRDSFYQLGDNYERFLEKMTIEKRQQYWRGIIKHVPHSANAFFVAVPEFFELLEERLRKALMRSDIGRHKGPALDL